MTPWLPAVVHALFIASLEAGLFYYWFAIADRYAVFLYEHLGAGPFDPMTVSRYRMSGLVAAGVVLVLYALANWFAGRMAGIRYRTYAPPDWRRVWLCALPPVSIALLWIMTTCNEPVLPLPLAAQCTLIATGALALALPAGQLAGNHPQELFWLGLAGAGIAPALLLLRVVELIPLRGISAGRAWGLALGSTLAGALWAWLIAKLHARFCPIQWKWYHLMVSGLVVSYLLLPLVHYLFMTPPGIHYITAADNFFARNLSVQTLCFLVSALISGLCSGSLPAKGGNRSPKNKPVQQ